MAAEASTDQDLDSRGHLTSRWSRRRGGPLSRPASRSVYRDSLGAAQRERWTAKENQELGSH